jgi:hypothetical protein
MSRSLRLKLRVDERTYPLLQKIFRGKVPTDRFQGGKNGRAVSIYVPLKSVLRNAEAIEAEDWGCTIMYLGRSIWCEYEIPKPLVKPGRVNHSGHRTKSSKALAGSRSCRPMHNWTKKRKAHIRKGVWG